MNYVTLNWNGQMLRVPALKYQGRLWFHWQGQTHVIEINSGARRSGGDKGKAHPGVLVAPMPGKVTKVAVHKGEQVTKGKALIVMEAMKMEYTLEADIDGMVKELNVEPGQQVDLGFVLARVGG